MDATNTEIGLRVRVIKLEPTDGMTVRFRNVVCRKEGVTGILVSRVPGHGGDVWFVKHDNSEDIGAYCVTEFEPLNRASDQHIKTVRSSIAELKVWLDEVEDHLVTGSVIPHILIEQTMKLASEICYEVGRANGTVLLERALQAEAEQKPVAKT